MDREIKRQTKRDGRTERATAEESLRKQAAFLLHGNVQSSLAACTVWLAMADQLLSPDANPPERGTVGESEGAAANGPSGARVAEADTESARAAAESEEAMAAETSLPAVPDVSRTRAVELIRKVRRELERLHKAEVPRVVHMLYPLVIDVGLRAAVEGLAERWARGEGTDGLAGSPGKSAFSVEICAGDSFAEWDRPTRDPAVIHARLEMYRLLETVFHRLAESGATGRVRVRLRFDVDGGRVVMQASFRSSEYDSAAAGPAEKGDAVPCGKPDGTGKAVLARFTRLVDGERFVRAGGTLEQCVDADEGFTLRASLLLPHGSA